MALSRIHITPSMDENTRINAINQNFQQVEAENRTKVIKDETGVNRILIGRDPKGRYVVAISREGVDVVAALDK